MSTHRRPPTIAIDFDGVIHRYSKGWQDGSCYDEPMPGALDFIRDVMGQGNPVFILSTRDPWQIARWLGDHGFQLPVEIIPCTSARSPFWNTVGILGITQRKLAAEVYIDDRAYRYSGQPFSAVAADLQQILQR